MTDPRRLLDSSPNQALRSLLGSGLDDAPGANALPKVAAALGVATVTVTASSLVATNLAVQASVSAKGAALAASAPASTAAIGFFGGNSIVALGKTLLVSMAAAGTLSAGTVAVYEYTEPSAASTARVERGGSVPTSPEQPAARVRREQAPPSSLPTLAETAPAEPAPAAAQPTPPAAHPGAPRPRHAAQRESASQVAPSDRVSLRAGVLAREVRQIDSARQALESRNADGALAALDGYERSRVVGVLDREALLLKIEALTQKQDLEQAKALARQYVERFPTDTHAPRLRALLGSTSVNVQAFPDE